MSKVTCCILPRMSVKRTSTYLTSFSLISLQDVFGGRAWSMSPWLRGRARMAAMESRRPAAPVSPVRMRMTSRTSETKILPSPILPVRAAPVMASSAAVELVVGDHHLDLDLGQEVDDVLGAAVELGLALLAAVALGLEHGHALDAQLLQRLLHLVQLERLDDGFDLLHRPSGRHGGVARPATRPSAREHFRRGGSSARPGGFRTVADSHARRRPYNGQRRPKI